MPRLSGAPSGTFAGPFNALAAAFLLAAAFAPADGAEWPGSAKLDAAIEEAIADGLTPGAVAWIESRDRRLHFASYGSRSVEPRREAMTADTIFDCASLTKVVVTAPAIMMLVEEGKVRLNDSLQVYLPEFSDSTRITVRQLLTHYSGLRPTLGLEEDWAGYETGLELALAEAPVQAPGKKFVYSDINFILLGEIVQRAGGMPLERFARERIFGPLGMDESMFRPPEALLERIAPTEKLEDGTILRGVVHDPTTRRMGGVAGHAGLFSTASDIARFARMMLNGGELDGTRVLSPLSVLRMRTPQSPPGGSARGIGWDINTPYSAPRGDLFGTASYGHTGYTGPSLWIDPVSHSFVALMTNRVHPTATTSVTRLRSVVASIVAAHLDQAGLAVPPAAAAAAGARDRPVLSEVRTGLDRLAEEGFATLRGKRIGILTNHTGIDRHRHRNVDLLAEADGVTVERIFTPEHGLDGTLEQSEIGDSFDRRTRIPVYSLYKSDRKRPPQELLEDLDALVFDIQDIGARFYTYITTMGYAMEAAAEAGIAFYVLDRPNPINGVAVEGPVLEPGLESFVGYHTIAVRHGMTVGELASMFNDERGIRADLHVVRMDGWHRQLWFDETGLPWVDPSPNIRTLDQAILYPGIALLEFLEAYSVGRGTDTPFQFVGSDWIDGAALASAIRQNSIPGIRVYSKQQRPRGSVFEGTLIDGVQFSIVNRDALQPTRLGLAVASAIASLYPGKADFGRNDRLIGNRAVVKALDSGRDTDTVRASAEDELDGFRARRRRYLLY